MIGPDILSRPVAETPLLTKGRLIVKAEALGVAGSHKARAARYVLHRAIREGHVAPGGKRRILEKTGGNFGVGLAYYGGKLNIGVDLVIGRSFSRVKRRICAEYGACLVGERELEAGATPRDVIEKMLVERKGEYFFLDQFNNQANLRAHSSETGPELVSQLFRMRLSPADALIFVAGAGTGASFTGIARALCASFPATRCVLAYPDSCDPLRGKFADHSMEGVAVGVVPPFLAQDLITESVAISEAQAAEGQRFCARTFGLYCGVSSGMNMAASLIMGQRYPQATVITILYDTGDAYIKNVS